MMTFKLGTYICILSMIPKTSKHYQLFHPASGLIFSNFFFLIYDFKFFKVLHLYIYVSTIVNFTDLLFKSQSCIENNYILKIQVNKIINLQCSLKKNLNPLWVVHSIANDAKSSSFTVRLTYLYPEINNTEIQGVFIW